MLNEKENIGVILRDMTKSLDGVSCIAACILAVAMAFINIAMPDLFGVKNTSQAAEKWLVIWIVSPFLSFLIYVRGHQIFDGNGSVWPVVRSMVVLVPVFVLICVNF